MASVAWVPGMATACGRCGGKSLSYRVDGTADCAACGAATPPAWSPSDRRTSTADLPSRAETAAPMITVVPGPGPVAPPPQGRPVSRRRGFFLPGRIRPGQRIAYAVGGLVCAGLAALVLGADAAAGTTGMLDGAFIGGFGVAGAVLLVGAILGRPIRWR